MTLTRFFDADNEEEPVAWHAEWGLQGESVGTEDSGPDGRLGSSSEKTTFGITVR